MKRIFSGLIILTILSFFGLALLKTNVNAQTVDDFEITSFEADYYVDKDDKDVGEMAVTEKITANFVNYGINHGILRAIPQTYEGHGLGLEVISVKDERGKTRPYTTYVHNDNLVLKIGNPDVYVYGPTTYAIDYKLRDVISFYETHDELFWDINGDDWLQPFGHVEARFHIPNTINMSGKPLCYSGSYGEQNQNCHIEVKEDTSETIVYASADNLDYYETLSVVIGFDSGTFQLDPWTDIWFMIQALLLITPPILTGVFMYRRWNSRGRDPMHISDTIPPQYAPPEGLNVLDSSIVLKESFDPSVISAAIIEMAIAGYIKIYETEKKRFLSKERKYELELVKSAKDLSDEQKEIIRAIFGSVAKTKKKVELSSLSNKLYSTATKLGKSLLDKMTNEGYFRASPIKVRGMYTASAVGVAVVGVPFFFIGLSALGVGLIIGALIVAAFIKAMPAKSIKGVQLKNHLLGQKDYMELAEKDRIEFLQSPQGAKEFSDVGDEKTKLNLYEKLLPYAMLFGIEKDWAKQFADLYEQPPDWMNSTNAFNAVRLTSALGGLSDSTATAFSAPSSSGSSGFSGGGFSGGGGGGGGGGGW